MRYGVSQVLDLMRTPAGRIEIYEGFRFRSWPVMSRVAKLHRKMLARKTKIVAIVGSFGKSTTTCAVTTGLGLPLHREFSFNCWTGVALAMLRIHGSQPLAVVEVGISDVGQMVKYADIVQPNIVVVTSIGSEHHRSLGTLEGTRHEKAFMVRKLSADGVAILNGDDPNVMWMQSQTKARIVTFGLGESNDVRASNMRVDWPHGTRFTLHSNGESREAAVRLFGQHMLYPILATVAVAHTTGLNLDDVLTRVGTLPPLSGRLQPIELPNNIWILRDDYKSQTETIHSALDVFAQVPAKRRIVVLGPVTEPTGKQREIYREIGLRLAKIADRIIIIGSTKDFDSYAAGVKQGGSLRSIVAHAGHNTQRVVGMLRELLQPGDALLIKGRFEQHLERITLALMGRNVRCEIRSCKLKIYCADCPMLSREWNGLGA